MKLNAEKGAQLDYLRRKLNHTRRNNRNDIQSSHSLSNPNLRNKELRRNLANQVRKKEGDLGELGTSSINPWISNWKS